MSAFMVWFLLVFVTNLHKPLIIISVISSVFILVSLITLLNSKMDGRQTEKILEDEDYVRKNPGSQWILETIQDRKNRDAFLDKSEKIANTVLKRCAAIMIAVSFVACGIPDRKEIAAIVLIPYMSNNPEFQKLPENLAKRLNDLLNDYVPEKQTEKDHD